MHVLIIHDALGEAHRPDEADTLAQSRAIAASLGRLGHVAEALPVGLDLGPLQRRLSEGGVDVVFNSMESLGGHARLLAAAPLLAESMGVPVAGCRPEAIHVTSNKPWAKAMLAGAGLPTPAWRTLAQLRAGRAVDGTAILKSVWEHSSVGLDAGSVVTPGGGGDAASAAALASALSARGPTLGGEGFAEAFVEGREIVVGVMPGDPRARDRGEAGEGPLPMVLPPCEIVFADWPADRPRLVGFAAKWDEASREYSTTVPTFEFADADVPLLGELRALATSCWRLFDLRGHARVDFRIDGAGRPWILEVNANPCLTPGAGFSRMLERAGVAYDAAIARLLAVAMPPPPRHAGRGASVVLGASGVGGTAPPAGQAGRRPRTWSLRSTLRRDDSSAVEALVAATGFFSPEEVTVAGSLVRETLDRGAEAGYEFLMADDASAGLVGYACFGRVPLTASAWDLYWIVVAPQVQGSGLGRALVDAVEVRVRSLGGTQLHAETAGRAQYAPTRAFYQRCGFEVVARLSDFYAPGDDKVVYRRLTTIA